MTVAALLWIVLTSAPVLAGVADGVQTSAPQDPQSLEDRIEALRRDLAQPGPEARSVRENAVHNLLLIPDRAAHELLCAALAQSKPDPDGVRIFILGALASRWRISADPVFGAEGRAELIRLYVASMARAFDAGPEIAVDGGSPEQRLVWNCLRSLSLLDQQRVFESLIVSSDESQRRASMRAMAGCRNLGLAPLLAGALDDAAPVADTARKALTMLTFVEQPFQDRQHFDAWYATHRSTDYTTLAERAGRRALATQSGRVAELEKQLIAALIRADAVEWNQLRSLLEGVSDGETLRVFLGELLAGLERRTSLGGSFEARGRLVDWLLRGLKTDLSTEEHGARLGVVARLVDRTDADDRSYTTVVARLVDGVRDQRAAVRIAAMQGLQRHFSTENRRTVVLAGEQALRDADFAVLGAALECLSAGSWVAPAAPIDAKAEPSPELASWLSLLRSVLHGAGVSTALRERAVQVLIQPTEQGPRLSSAYRLLLDIAGTPDSDLDIAVRKVALGRLRIFDEDGRDGLYVQALVALLEDPAAELRESAARLLGSISTGSRGAGADWITMVVSHLGVRLSTEDEEAPFRAVFESLMQLAGGPVDATNVIGRFCQAAVAFAERDPSAQKPFQRDILAAGLQRLGAVQGRPLEQWTAIGESLGRLEDRTGLRFVLERQRVASLADSDDPLVARAWQLVIQAAALATDFEEWSQAEAAEIELAYLRLEALAEPSDRPADRALRVLALAALGRHAAVLERGTAALDEQLQPLAGASRDSVIFAVADAHIAGGKLVAAGAILSEVEGGESSRSLTLRTKLAKSHLEKREFDAAARLSKRVMQATRATSPAFPERFLLDCEARFRANPNAERAAVLEDLREQTELFEAESTPVQHRTRFLELESELSNRSSGG